MTSKLFVVFSAFILFSSCELKPPLKTSQTANDVVTNKTICVWQNYSDTNECKIEYWLRFWYDIEDISWPERIKNIRII
jgi:hypothetical protein